MPPPARPLLPAQGSCATGADDADLYVVLGATVVSPYGEAGYLMPDKYKRGSGIKVLAVRASTTKGSVAQGTFSAVNVCVGRNQYPDFVELDDQPFKKVFMAILVSLCLWHSADGLRMANAWVL